MYYFNFAEVVQKIFFLFVFSHENESACKQIKTFSGFHKISGSATKF